MKSGPTFDYSGTDGTAYHERRRLPAPAEDWIATVRAEKFQSWVKPSDVVFEYGVGFGWNLAKLHCARKAGFDVAPGLDEIVQSKQIEFHSELTTLSAEFFDVVICHHTIEHLKDPANALSAIQRLLKRGGTLLLNVPYEKERKFRHFNPNDKAGHLYSWTPSSLANLVLAVGYQLESVRLQRFRFDRAAAALALRLKLGCPGYRTIRRVAQLLLPEYEIALVARRARD